MRRSFELVQVELRQWKDKHKQQPTSTFATVSNNFSPSRVAKLHLDVSTMFLNYQTEINKLNTVITTVYS